ncbi:hypothetical protein VPH35_009746 [Triticum aestivum]
MPAASGASGAARHAPSCRRWGTPWEFPIHHGRRCQGILQGDVKDAMDMQLLK